MNRNSRMNKLVAGLAVAAALASCQQKGTTVDTTSKDFMMVETQVDSTEYGIFLRGGKDSLQWLSEAGDTAWLISSYARVFGQPEAGDRVAVVFSEDDERSVKNLIDITQLMGRWVEPDAVDEGMVQGIELQEGGAANSINSRANHYVSWRLYNGKLLLVNSVDGIVDVDAPEDTLLIDELTKTSLKVTARYSKHFYRHSANVQEDTMKDYASYDSPDAQAFDPEGEAPEGTDAEIPEEDKVF